MMVKCLILYGWHGAYALGVCVDNEVRKQAWMDYTADILAMIARPNYETNIPLFTELMSPEQQKPKTASEIKSDILKKLEV